jgi:hypothetical protein
MNTDKYILEQILEKPETKIFRYIIERKNYSGQFYSNGKHN